MPHLSICDYLTSNQRTGAHNVHNHCAKTTSVWLCFEYVLGFVGVSSSEVTVAYMCKTIQYKN